MAHFVDQDGDKHGEDPHQQLDGAAFAAAQPQEDGDHPEERMHADRDSPNLKVKITLGWRGLANQHHLACRSTGYASFSRF